MTPNALFDDGADVWTAALVGGIASIPLTVAVYLQSGAGTGFSLGAVVLGGVVAGYLADVGANDATAAGFRAGVVGGLPVFASFAYDVAAAADALAGPAWFLVAAAVLVTLAVASVLTITGVAGLVGGTVGRWLAGKVDRPRRPVTGT